MPPIRVTLDQEAYDRLIAVARSERRELNDQAAWLISQELCPRPTRLREVKENDIG